MAATLTEQYFEADDSEPTMKKFRLRRKSSSEKEIVEAFLKATKIIYDYGPPELNLFKYLADEAHFLWEKENEKHKDDNEPMNGIVLIHDDDTEIAERCLHFLGFDLRSNELESGDCLLKGQQEVICVFLLRETFWKASNIAFEEVLNNVVKNIAKANVFFMVSNEDISRAYEFCKRYNVCPQSNVISQAENKKVFYDTFYDILERQMTSFLHELQARTFTGDVTIEEELKGLIEELHERKITTKPKLKAQCLARIKEASEYGVVGYRLLDNKLFVFVDGPLMMGTDKKTQLERSIEDFFNGKVTITPLRTFLKPHCAIKCGGYITNNKINKSGTIGVFGKMRNLVKNDIERTVALSSPNLFSDGDIASLPNGEDVGVCFWPVKLEPYMENIIDVSIVEIDSTRIDTIQRSIFNEHILVEECPYEYLNHRLVFKYGAKTQTTYGWIKKINDFELFERDILTILPKSPATLFSEEGDSGAIVVTIIGGIHYGVGMVYGSHLDLLNTNNESTKIPTVAIFLKNALERFTRRKQMSISFEEI